MTAAMEQIASGDANQIQVGALLTALRTKGETAEEISSAARVMRRHAKKVDVAGESRRRHLRHRRGRGEHLQHLHGGRHRRGGGGRVGCQARQPVGVVALWFRGRARGARRRARRHGGVPAVPAEGATRLPLRTPPPLGVQGGGGHSHRARECRRSSTSSARWRTRLRPRGRSSACRRRVMSPSSRMRCGRSAPSTRSSCTATGRTRSPSAARRSCTRCARIPCRRSRSPRMNSGCRPGGVRTCVVAMPTRNAAICTTVLSGETGGPRDAVLANAGAALYVAGRARSIRAGVELAARAIDDGRARRTLATVVALSRAK